MTFQEYLDKTLPGKSPEFTDSQLTLIERYAHWERKDTEVNTMRRVIDIVWSYVYEYISSKSGVPIDEIRQEMRAFKYGESDKPSLHTEL